MHIHACNVYVIYMRVGCVFCCLLRAFVFMADQPPRKSVCLIFALLQHTHVDNLIINFIVNTTTVPTRSVSMIIVSVLALRSVLVLG